MRSVPLHREFESHSTRSTPYNPTRLDLALSNQTLDISSITIKVAPRRMAHERSLFVTESFTETDHKELIAELRRKADEECAGS